MILKNLSRTLLSRFNNLYSFSPVIATTHKLYAPIAPEENEGIDFVYVLQLIPSTRGILRTKKEEILIKLY